MSDQLTAPQPEPQPSEEDQIVDVLSEPDPQPQEGEEDEAELEIGPDKVKVKKVVKEAWDNLQKSTQARAEEIKAEKALVATERQRSTEASQIMMAVNDDLVELKALDKQIAPYMKLTPADWMAWSEQDSEAARKAQTGLQAMLTQRNQMFEAMKGKVTDIQGKNQAAQAEWRQKAQAEIATKHKDWTPEKQTAFKTAALADGFSEAELDPMLHDPRVIPWVKDALAYRAAMAKAKAKTASANAAPEPEPQPRMRASGTRDTTGLGDNVPVDQWRKNFLKKTGRA